MDESFESLGNWFLPERPDRTVAGELRFGPDSGLELDLVGSLRGEGIATLNEAFQTPIILGVLTSGQAVTLLDCTETASNVSFHSSAGTSMTSKFIARFAFRGVHFPSETDISFDRWTVRLDFLDEWACLAGFTIEVQENRPTSVTYQPSDSVPALDNDVLEVSLGVRSTLFGLGMIQRRVGFEQEAYFELKAKTDRGLLRYMSAMSHLANFLALAVGQAVRPIAISGFTPARQEETELGRPYQLPVEVLYQLPNPKTEARKLLPVEMLFHLRQTADQLPILLGRWFENFELLKPVYDLYFGTLYNPRMYLDQRFLALVQALESYHRRRFGAPPTQEHRQRVARILAATSGADRSWLKEKLAYSHEPSLRQRLRALLDLHGEATALFIGARRAFINVVVATRNYLTHYDRSLEREAAQGEDLYYLSERLKGLVVACLLAEVGFTNTEIKGLLEGNSRFARELARAASKSQSGPT